MEITLAENKQMHDIRALAKLQSPEFKEIYSHTSGVIMTKKLKKVFRNKNSEMNIDL